MRWEECKDFSTHTLYSSAGCIEPLPRVLEVIIIEEEKEEAPACAVLTTVVTGTFGFGRHWDIWRHLVLSHIQIESSDFLKFLIPCGRHLTRLQLHYCNFINDSTLPQIVEICQNLKVLSLEALNLTDEGVLCLENLQFLECLTLIHINIKSETLCKILRRNRRIHHLCILYTKYINVDDVAVELRNLCPDLESIRVMENPLLTSRGIDALADCKNLREVDFGICGSFNHGDCFHKLFSSCQRLEKISLNHFRGLTDYDLEALTLCKNLKYLNLMDVSLTSATCLKILLNCPKLFLEKFFLSYNANQWDETKNLLNQWKQKYSMHDRANYMRVYMQLKRMHRRRKILRENYFF